MFIGPKYIEADSSKIKRFVPDSVVTVSFAQDIKCTIEWFDAEPKRRVVDKEYNCIMDRTIEACEKATLK
jgi:hypothetical protein